MISIRCLALLLLIALCTLQARAADETLSLDGATQTLKQDFKTAPVWRQGGVQVDDRALPLTDPSFSWAAGYIWDHALVGAPAPGPPPKHNFPAWTSDGNDDADPNGDMIAAIGPALSPLSWSGTLKLIARKMPTENLAASIGKTDPRNYMSAAITSFPYAQTYGVFAMSAKLPHEHGVWPAFWLLPASKKWPPEIDIMELIGREPSTIYTTVHLADQKALGHGIDTHLDLSADFHEYAADWGPETIKWYFDRKLVFTQPTPPELQGVPCYILANLAVGKASNWGGAPDETTRLPATMEIKSIAAWQRPAYIQ